MAHLKAAIAFDRASFVQIREIEVLEQPLISRGEVLLTESGFIWHQTEPFENRLIFNGETLVEHTRMGDAEIVQAVEDPVSLNITRTLYQMMSGSWSDMTSNFHIAASETEAGVWRVELVPISEAVSTFLPMILLEGQEHLGCISVQQTGGMHTRIELSDQRREE